MTGSDAVLLGQYRGFSMVLAYDGRSNEYRITLKGTLSHTVTLGADVFGNITRLDNALENLAGSLQAEQNSLEETKTQLETPAPNWLPHLPARRSWRRKQPV